MCFGAGSTLGITSYKTFNFISSGGTRGCLLDNLLTGCKEVRSEVQHFFAEHAPAPSVGFSKSDNRAEDESTTWNVGTVHMLKIMKVKNLFQKSRKLIRSSK